MKYMLILCLQKMVNISSNAKMTVIQKNAVMILEMIVPLHIFREVIVFCMKIRYTITGNS